MIALFDNNNLQNNEWLFELIVDSLKKAKNNPRISTIVNNLNLDNCRKEYQNLIDVTNYLIVHLDLKEHVITKMLFCKLCNTDLHKKGLGMYPLYFFSTSGKYDYKNTKRMYNLMVKQAKLDGCSWYVTSKMISTDKYQITYHDI